MAMVIFVEYDGTQHPVNIETGKSLMQLATDNGVQGIDADCGGGCACGTCHVILEPQWLVMMDNAKPDELQMLDFTPEKTSTSRLSCQIQMSETMDGMKVHLPEFQM